MGNPLLRDPYYLAAPFQGAALAPIAYLLFRSSVVGAPGEQGTLHLNPIGIYGFPP